jgi:hypothetical protein
MLQKIAIFQDFIAAKTRTRPAFNDYIIIQITFAGKQSIVWGQKTATPTCKKNKETE